MGASSSKPETYASTAASSSSTSSESDMLNEKPRQFEGRSSTSQRVRACHKPRQPISPTGEITLDTVSQWESTITSDPKLSLSRTILNHQDIRSTLQNRQTKIADAHVFNTHLDFKAGPITNQKSSGRCWLFATTNVLRYNVMKKLSLSDFQLSQVCHSIPHESL